MDDVNSSIKGLFVKTDDPIRKAMETIDAGAKQIALVIDDKNKLIGTLTDGDIRRGILRGLNYDCVVADMMQTNFIAASSTGVAEIRSEALARGVKLVPIVDNSGVPQALHAISEMSNSSEDGTEVVLMAGGLGTRLRPLTESTPKPMLEVGGKPILQRIIENFVSQGLFKFHIALNYKADQIRNYFKDGSEFGARINYIEEKKRLGTAGALSLLKNRPNKPFIVMNADLFTSLQFNALTNFHLDTDASATMCLRKYDVNVPYGVVHLSGLKVERLVEKPRYENFINSGIYILSPEVFEYIKYDEYLDMPTLIERLLFDGRQVSGFPMHEYWIDIGQMHELERAREEIPGLEK